MVSVHVGILCNHLYHNMNFTSCFLLLVLHPLCPCSGSRRRSPRPSKPCRSATWRPTPRWPVRMLRPTCCAVHWKPSSSMASKANTSAPKPAVASGKVAASLSQTSGGCSSLSLTGRSKVMASLLPNLRNSELSGYTQVLCPVVFLCPPVLDFDRKYLQVQERCKKEFMRTLAEKATVILRGPDSIKQIMRYCLKFPFLYLFIFCARWSSELFRNSQAKLRGLLVSDTMSL